MTGKSRIFVVSCLALLFVTISIVCVVSFHASRREYTKQQIAKSIADINAWLSDTNWIVDQSKKLVAIDSLAGGSAWPWFSEHFIRFKSGEWMVCCSGCSKHDPKAADFWVGKGSDGKWYFSSFHFCVGMIVLMGDGSPDSLASFVNDYYVHEFGGNPEDALKKTWPDPTRKSARW